MASTKKKTWNSWFMRLKIFPSIDRYTNLDWVLVIMKFESRLSKCQVTNMDTKIVQCYQIVELYNCNLL
jgi:hypothetical protein